MSKIFYPATSLALSNTTNKLNYYAYSHTIVVDLIKNFKLPYTICYLHNIYGSLTNSIKILAASTPPSAAPAPIKV
jgi:hypothetical protein